MAINDEAVVGERIYFASALAVNGISLLVDESDWENLGQIASEASAITGARIHAFAWLSRQLLLVLGVTRAPVSEVVRRITSRHARHINARQGYKGRVFRHPSRYVLLERPEQVLLGVSIVHLSPLWEGLVNNPDDYRWSSHGVYLGLRDIPWVTRDLVEGLLASGKRRRRRDPRPGYRELIERERLAYERHRRRVEQAPAKMPRAP